MSTTHHYRVVVDHNGDMIQVYPQGRERFDASLDDACKRIGMMVMAENIESITVYRDGEIYRQCVVGKAEV